ncbi:hypothetical protein PGTUg99_002553 [Puccinia graminis f. sp. tritici]|uniref:Uncharacterized protein n=1 Tax=Puccinia graminis f. sp. tritici TaxID=56615 RepID=A0A5B0PRP1_PUCGR|nr:hypothetical protein PGTUg99_002553 [Puccinia graminis f. sp. tritici]
MMVDLAYFSLTSLWFLVLFPVGLVSIKADSSLGSLGRSIEEHSGDRAERNAGPLSAIPVKRKSRNRMPSLVPCVRIPGPGKRRTSDPAAAERRARVTDNWDLNRGKNLV